jgi:DNA-binding MarR family transcriptional regulator
MAPKRNTAVLDPAQCQEMVANCACFNFRKVSRSVTQLFDQILAPCGLRSTQLVILLAAQVLGPCGLAKLAREMVMDRSTITRNLSPLVGQGLLKITGKSGRAGKSVEITPAGQQLLAEAAPY